MREVRIERGYTRHAEGSVLVAFGENDIKSVEDLAGCATDDLIGWSERKDG